MSTAYVRYIPEGGVTTDWERRFLSEHGPKMAAMATVASASPRHNDTEAIVKIEFDGPPNQNPEARTAAMEHSATLGATGHIEDLEEGERCWSAMPRLGPTWRR